MILLVGSSTDPLITTVNQCLETAQARVRVIDESELFETVPFGLEINGSARAGFVRIDDGEMPLTDLTAVVLRPQRKWWPSENYSLKDQLFIYHETVAAWLTLLSGLTCPVINRFEMGWWLQDLNYPARLRSELAARLGCDLTPCSPQFADLHHAVSGPPAVGERRRCVYLVGSRLIHSQTSSESCVDWLTQRASAVGAWQREHGIGLCRLDFDGDDPLTLAHVEISPSMEGEPALLIAQIAGNVAVMAA